ncbi:FAD-dependent oxidoreductase [Thalassobaculum sp.]|uniref:FAD-dependent oxidoreductase n=1 Tax=Thalassobaculum sp. TaxID=2022740 RepID=UPI0032EE716A
MAVLPADVAFDVSVPLVIVGAGACGLTAALAAHEQGAGVLVLERDSVPRGSTAMSSGMIPAAGTRFQAEHGVEDSPELLARDIMAKNHDAADQAVVAAVTAASGATVEWLADRWRVPLSLVTGFLYPGHSVMRMHAPPSRTGAELIGALSRAVEEAGVDMVTEARVTDLFAGPDGRIEGLAYGRPDGTVERVGCDRLVLACNGYGGNPEMVRRFIPEMAGARYHGHAGNVGDAVTWGEALGAQLADMGAYQGHGSLAEPHAILITWALMMEGGIQVNAEGRRFSNEHLGYSEQAAAVIAQPGAVAWNVYDARLHALGRDFDDYREAEAAGAVRSGATVAELAAATGLPAEALAASLEQAARGVAGETDPFGRDFTGKPGLQAPYYAVKVTGALFHTQGGLAVDPDGRVLRADGRRMPNLYAGGGAARGLSGSAGFGYLSGNGLLSAAVLGRICGTVASRP